MAIDIFLFALWTMKAGFNVRFHGLQPDLVMCPLKTVVQSSMNASVFKGHTTPLFQRAKWQKNVNSQLCGHVRFIPFGHYNLVKNF